MLPGSHLRMRIPRFRSQGDPRWRQIVDAYWRSGVTERGYFITGAQTNGEVWSPPNSLSSRLGFRTQEHCTVYNMMRLADCLLRWSDEPGYADYWERNLWNGILAQQHPETGMIAYFLPLYAGAEKVWGTPTEDFWCCHGSLVQAHTLYANHIWYESEDSLTLSQYIPNKLTWARDGQPMTLRLTQDAQLQSRRRPASWAYDLHVQAAQPVECTLRLRLPWWLSGKAQISLNGEPIAVEGAPSSYVEIRRTWTDDKIHLLFPKALMAVPLPDEPEICGFIDGPVVLAGLNPGGQSTAAHSKAGSSYTARPNYRINGMALKGNPAHPESFLTPDNEREWSYWRGDYRTRGQGQDIRFIPLHEVRDEVFTVYFPVQS